MSDTFAIRRYHRQTTMPAVGTTRKKYLILLGLVLLSAALGTAYLLYSSGLFSEANPQIAEQLTSRINLERQANNLAPVQPDSPLANQALARSKEVKIAGFGYPNAAGSAADAGTNIFILPKIRLALSGNGLEQQAFDTLAEEDPAFRQNILNPHYSAVGVGITSDSYNYYIVTRWK